MTAIAAPDIITTPKVRSPLMLSQQQWVRDDSTIKLWSKSRRIGATYAEASDVASSRLTKRRNEDYWFSSADESAAYEFAEYVGFWCKVFDHVVNVTTEQLDDGGGTSATAYCVRFPSGKRMTAMSSNPRRFRSKGGDVCLDEFAFHEKAREMLKAASPCTTWGGRMRILSSHNGEASVFNDLVKMGQRRKDSTSNRGDMPISLHTTTIVQAVAEGLVEKINEVKGTTFTREGFLADCRAKCYTEDDWLQEYMCIPSAETEAYLPYDILNPCVGRPGRVATRTDYLNVFMAEIAKFSEGASALFAGGDIGRTNDRFVLWVLARFGGRLESAGLLSWQGRPFDDMEQSIEALMTNGLLRRLCLDSTGLGMQLAERMKRKFRDRVEPVTFSNASKAAMAPRVRVACEQATVSLPDDRIVKDDLHSLRKTVTAAGNTRYAGERTKDGHADHFWALALALEAAHEEHAPAQAVTVVGGDF